jgi:hypothetical protein
MTARLVPVVAVVVWLIVCLAVSATRAEYDRCRRRRLREIDRRYNAGPYRWRRTWI